MQIISEPDQSWAFADMTPSKTQYMTHGYHRYPAKFIPQIVSRLIEEYSSPKDCICDPFGGCGTTLVEAKLAGRPSFGYDINPLAVLIAQAKTTAIYPTTLLKKFTALRQDLEQGLTASPVAVESHLNIDRLIYWFGETNLSKLISLRTRLEQEREPNICRFFLCGLSQVLKNCSYWLTTSTKPQKDPNKSPEPPVDAFVRQTSRMIVRNKAFHEELRRKGHYNVPAIMLKADARNLPMRDQSVDLIITSPPYSTSYDYADIHQLSTLLFGFCSSIKDFRRDFIGTHSRGQQYENSRVLQNLKRTKPMRELERVDTRSARVVLKYFCDMDQVYREIHRVLRRGRRACVVIADTELRGVPIPNVEFSINQMGQTGFIPEKIIKRPVPNRILAPFRDKHTGRFTSPSSGKAKGVYTHEYIIVVRKK
jgi:DNA modification methylase